MQRFYFAWSAINVALCIYILILMCYFWEYLNDLDCIHKQEIWLLIYLVIQALHLARSITVICFWRKAADPVYM